MGIKKVYLIFKTHLDIGFTDYAENVKEKYLTRFIPNAIATARQLLRHAGAYPHLLLLL